MNNESRQLIERVASLTDQDLLRMACLEFDQYQSEAITYAKAEISKRGIPISQVDFSSLSTPTFTHPLVKWAQKFHQSIVSLIRARAFSFGFLAGVVIFVLANIRSYSQMGEMMNCCDGFDSFGFPFKWYTYGGFAGMVYIHWGMVAADVIAALCLCLFSGWLFKKLLKTSLSNESLWNQ